MIKVKDVSAILENADRKQLIEIISKMTGFSRKAESWLVEEYGNSSDSVVQGLKIELWLNDMWRQVRPIIKEANLVGIQDHEEEMEAEEILTYLSEPEDIELASWSVRKKLVNEMSAEYIHGDGDFDDSLLGVMKNLCISDKEKEYLRGKIGRV